MSYDLKNTHKTESTPCCHLEDRKKSSRQAEHIAAPTLLVQILKEQVFDKLRTEHGLGYNAGMKLELGPQESAVRIWVECPEYSCLEAARIMLDFIKEAPEMLERLSLKELERYRDGCIKTADEKIETLDQYQSWAWNSIYERTYNFHKPERMVKALQKTTKDQLVDLAKQMNPTSHESTQLWLFMEAKKRETAEDNPDYITLFPAIREVAFVKGMSNFPDLSTPEEAEENPEDFLVKPEDLCCAEKSMVVC